MKTQVYSVGTSVVFFSYDSVTIPTPSPIFLRSVPSALLTIDEAEQAGYIQFSQIDNTAGLPSPFLSALFTDIVNTLGINYVSISTMIAAITPAAGGGGGGSAPNIVTYDLQVDTGVGYDTFIRVLTVFDPVTNAPTRTFTTLAGVAYTPVNPALVMPFVNLPLEQHLYSINNNIGILRETSDNIRVELGLEFIAGDTLPQESFLSIQNAGARLIDTPKTRKIQIIALTGTFTVGGVTFPLATAAGGVIADYSVEATNTRSVKLAYEVDTNSTVLEVVLRG